MAGARSRCVVKGCGAARVQLAESGRWIAKGTALSACCVLGGHRASKTKLEYHPESHGVRAGSCHRRVPLRRSSAMHRSALFASRYVDMTPS